MNSGSGFEEVNLHAAQSPPPSPPQIPPPPPPHEGEVGRKGGKTSFATIGKISKSARKFSSLYEPSKKDLALPTKVIKKDEGVLRRTKSFITRKHQSTKDISGSKQQETCVKRFPTFVSKQTQTYVDIQKDDKVLFPSNRVILRSDASIYEAPENVYNSLTTKVDVHR